MYVNLICEEQKDHQLKNNNSGDETNCAMRSYCLSLFNDTYSLSVNNQSLDINKKDISWKSDRDHKFGKDVYPTNFQNGTLRGGAILNETKPLSEQEDLNVWMRTAALPTFRKLYGKIETDLQEDPGGQLAYHIDSSFGTAEAATTKSWQILQPFTFLK
ncbi:hypothetical protein Leryth_012631 [Lithospermum erythrorhizon]|nr:hypothetical protein Leryth_012631 [Lithospermum erythrorhizon]